jgi:hypothetical protein
MDNRGILENEDIQKEESGDDGQINHRCKPETIAETKGNDLASTFSIKDREFIVRFRK